MKKQSIKKVTSSTNNSNKNNKNKFGQYFTPKVVADFMISLADISATSSILEPSSGKGIFLELLQTKGYHNLTAYEIDSDLATTHFPFVRHESFISAKIDKKFDLIIGNPPYIRWKNLEDELKYELSFNTIWNQYFNSLCDYLYIFILKSIELLNENGQLVFICPEYWMTTSHANGLRNYMIQNGYFEEIYHFNETPVFEKVSISIVIFKYIKYAKNEIHKISKKIKVAKFHNNKYLTTAILNSLRTQTPLQGAEYLEVSPFKTHERWLLQSDATRAELQKLEILCKNNNYSSLYHTIGEVCDIGNGLVSGLDKVFQITEEINQLNANEIEASINVIKAKDLAPFFGRKITKYIFLKESLTENDFQKSYPNYFLHFKKHQQILEERYQYKRKINYWEWVFLRNFHLFNKNEKRIFVPCKERISHKNYFRFALVDKNIFPTQDVTAIFKKPDTKESIEYITAYLNHPIIFEWLKCNGVIKGNIVEFSEKPISSIPYRKIDWGNNNEIQIHDAITNLVQNITTDNNLTKINNLLHQLLEWS